MKKLSFILSVIILSTISCKQSKNPLLEEWDTPFQTPPFDKINAGHFKPAIIKAMEIHNKEIDKIIKDKNEPTFENCIVKLDNSGEKLYEITLILFNMIEANSNDTLEQIAQEIFTNAF